jgi:hypothetical protein
MIEVPVLNKLALLLFVSISISAQGSSQTTRPTRPDPIQRELQRRFESEAIERVLAEGPHRRPDYERRALLTQIRQDFLQIQIVNDELQKSAANTRPLDLKLIAKSAAEIARCAQRLQGNLALPKNEEDLKSQEAKELIPKELTPSGLRLLLGVLNGAINAFVANPVFEKSGVVDAKLSAQASSDLGQIIEVSKQVKKSSERLKRSTVKPAI